MIKKYKEILIIVGSGTENANTDTLAEAFKQGAIEAGHTVSKVFLGDKSITPCNGCNACQHDNPCAI